MAATTSSYSITMRLHTAPDHGVVGAVATAIAHAGGIVTAIDVAESSHERLVVDVTCSASDADHAAELAAAVDQVQGVEVYKTSDRTFLLHLGGKIEVTSKVPMRNRDDLSMAYTPGVGRVSMAIAEHPEDVWRLTIKGNTVAVVTDGSAVLGLGNIGPGAAMPVMEGKAALFKRFANIDAWPICLASQDTDEIVRAVEMIAPGFGGINLEDIAAPRCFEIERRLRESLDIPVFHDDQHGTAIVVLAALTNALRVVKKHLADVRVVVSGGGAAGTAIVTLLLAAGVEDVVVVDREGALCADDDVAVPRAPRARRGHQPAPGHAATCATVLRGADVFIGVSAPGILSPSGSRTWPTTRSSSRWPTPTPRSTPPRPRSTPPSSPAAAPTTRTRSTTCWPSPASSAGCSTPAPGDHPRDAAARRRGDRAGGQGRGAEPELHHPEGLPPRRAQGGRRRDPRHGRLIPAVPAQAPPSQA